MANVNTFISLEETASAAASGGYTLGIDYLDYFINDGAYNITYNFENGTGASGAATLQPGEKLSGDMYIGTLYLTAATDSTFRLRGRKVNSK